MKSHLLIGLTFVAICLISGSVADDFELFPKSYEAVESVPIWQFLRVNAKKDLFNITFYVTASNKDIGVTYSPTGNKLGNILYNTSKTENFQMQGPKGTWSFNITLVYNNGTGLTAKSSTIDIYIAEDNFQQSSSGSSSKLRLAVGLAVGALILAVLAILTLGIIYKKFKNKSKAYKRLRSELEIVKRSTSMQSIPNFGDGSNIDPEVMAKINADLEGGIKDEDTPRKVHLPKITPRDDYEDEKPKTPVEAPTEKKEKKEKKERRNKGSEIELKPVDKTKSKLPNTTDSVSVIYANSNSDHNNKTSPPDSTIYIN